MARALTDNPTREKPLRLWPGVVLVVLQWLATFVVPALGSDARFWGVSLGVFGGALAILTWWVLFSRAPWPERLGAVFVVVIAMVATRPVLHESVAQGNLGFQYFLFAIPSACLALVAAAVVTRDCSVRSRRVTMVAALLLGCGGWALVRSEGLRGEGAPDLTWRWARTAEDRLLADGDEEPAAQRDATAAKAKAEWPGFRGPDRDGGISGVRIETDWSTAPPVELWRRAVGPAVSSFAVRGDVFYTQEQRGTDEIVASYRLTTGEPLWRHREPVRFWDSHVGAGPRGTPALSGRRLFTLGATGIVHALDAADGEVIWRRDTATDLDKTVPDFGFTGSPLVVDDIVVVAVAGRLAAYDAQTGQTRWLGPQGRGGSYSSPHLLTIDGVDQVLLLSGAGATSVAPADGTVLWEHEWSGTSYLQPALVDGGDLLIGDIDFMPRGMRRLTVTRGADGWAVGERWSSAQLKPHFNDFVVHQGHAYGFDGRILACIDVDDGERKWKGGRFGHGQLVVLRDQDLLLVLSERGELALVAATPDRFTELARFPAIEGRTWNHPALAGNVLLVRNGEEMAAFRLPLTGG